MTPLSFPNCKDFSELFEVIDEPRKYLNRGPNRYELAAPHTSSVVSSYMSTTGGRTGRYSINVKPSEAVMEAIEKRMLPMDGGYYFNACFRDDGTVLLVVKYQVIIGSRWLALVSRESAEKAFAEIVVDKLNQHG